MMDTLDLRLVIKQHYPLWKDVPIETIHLQKLNGITNQTYKASALNSNYPPIIFRKFGPSSSNPFLKRETQAEVYECAHKYGIGPQIFYFNEQFRLEQYFESTVLTANQMLIKGCREKAAFSIAKFHQLKPKSQNFPKNSLIQRIFIDGMQKIIADCSQKLQEFAHNEQQKKLKSLIKELISKEELSLLANYMKLLQKESLVFCHNDVLPYNFLIQDKTGKIVLIDYEYAGYNYPICDLAYYITESYFNYEKKQWPYFSCELQSNSEGEIAFIEEYVISQELKHQQFKEGLESLRQSPKYTTKIVRLLDSLALGKMMVNLVWCYWRIMAGKAPNVPFDYWEFIKIRHQLYQKYKQQFLARLHHYTI